MRVSSGHDGPDAQYLPLSAQYTGRKVHVKAMLRMSYHRLISAPWGAFLCNQTPAHGMRHARSAEQTSPPQHGWFSQESPS